MAALVSSLLRTGNSADTATEACRGIAISIACSRSILQPLGALGTVDLVFTAGNDADALPTSFWIDGVRLCMTWGDPPKRTYLPLMLNATSARG